jgi:hypothetical protein
MAKHGTDRVQVNLRTTHEWRKLADRKARQRGLSLSEYLRHLVEQDTAA